jgi:SET domain-containing protein
VEVRVITDIIVKAAGIKGLGVFALRDFSPGEFIFRRRYGRILRNDQIDTLSADDQRHLCELDWERSAVLLSPGCYLNHACDPNAMRKGVKVFAWKPIHASEEVTIDYRLNAFTSEQWECVCGSANCQGAVTSSFFSLSEAQQAAYLPYAPTFIQREYQERHGQRQLKRQHV